MDDWRHIVSIPFAPQPSNLIELSNLATIPSSMPINNNVSNRWLDEIGRNSNSNSNVSNSNSNVSNRWLDEIDRNSDSDSDTDTDTEFYNPVLITMTKEEFNKFKTIENREEGICVICQESYTGDVIEIKCKHKFDKTCIENWLLKSSSKCPICRMDNRS